MLDNREYGLRFAAGGYQVVRYDEGLARWVARERGDHQLPEWARVSIELEGQPLRLPAPGNQQSLEEEADEDDEEKSVSVEWPEIGEKTSAKFVGWEFWTGTYLGRELARVVRAIEQAGLVEILAIDLMSGRTEAYFSKRIVVNDSDELAARLLEGLKRHFFAGGRRARERRRRPA